MVSGTVLWSPDSLRQFYDALHKHGADWTKVVEELPDKNAEACETLYKQHQTFLKLPHSPALSAAFVAMVQDHYNNLKEEALTGDAAGPAKQASDVPEAANGHGPGHADRSSAEQKGTTEALQPDMHEAEDEGNSNHQVHSQRSKRTPKPTAKMLASTPLSKRAAAGMSPKSATRVKSPDHETGSARKRRQRRLFDEPDEQQQQQQPFAGRWKGPSRIDDFGDGVDALLSLATVAHNARAASSSMNEALPQASTTPAVTAMTDPSAAGGTADGTATEGDPMAVGMDEEAEGGAGRGARASSELPGPPHLQAVLSPSKSKGASMRGTPGGVSTGTGVKASPRRATAGKGGRARTTSAKTTGNRFKRGGRKRNSMYASDSSDEDGDLGERGPMTVPMLRTSSAASQLPRSTGLGKRGADGHRGGSHKRQLQAAQDLGLHDPVMGILPLDPGADFYGYDLSAGSLPALNMASHLGLDGGLPPVSTSITGLPLRLRRRKPMPERLAVMSPAIKALLPGGTGGSGGGSTNRGAAATSTPTASAAAAAAAAALSPGLLGSPGFLQGINMAMLAAGDPLASPSEASLRHCLASPRLRRWVAFEFQVSAMDRPWFLRNELVELVSALCGGGAMPQRLTRPEWALVRGAFGRPRRLSLQFLKEERVKLEAYREHVRRVYEQAAAGGPPVAPELPQPLRVGQAVVARHPTTRQLHDGTLLTVMGSRCRVQFNRSELMTEVVRDVDIMPVDPYENLPLSLPVVPLVLNGRPRPVAGAVGRRRATSRHIPRGAPADTGRLVPGGATGSATFNGILGALGMAGGSGDGGEFASDEALSAEVTRLLEEKEATLAKLRQLNGEAEKAKLTSEERHSESFQQSYTRVVLRLKEVNSKLEPMLEQLSGRARHVALLANAAPSNSVPPGVSGAAATNLQDISSPLAAVPPGSAMAGGMLGEFQPESMPGVSGNVAAGASDGGAAPSQALSAALSAGASGQASDTVIVEPLAAPAIVPRGGGSAMSDSVTVASAIVAAALTDARSMVEQVTGGSSAAQVLKMEHDGSQTLTVAPLLTDSEPAAHTTPLVRLVTSCMAMLLTVQQCTGEAVSGPVSEQALDSAVRMLQPTSASNEDKYARIAEQVQVLKAQLASKV